MSTRTVALGAEQQGPDAAIRLGAGDWPGVRCERLCGDWLITVCSPTLLDRFGVPRNGPVPVSLFEQAPLLRHEGSHTADWFKQAGLTLGRGRPGLMFRDAGVQVQACKAGQGLALVRRTLAADALANGDLVRAHPMALPSPWDYYLVYPNGSIRPAVRMLRDWLKDQVRASGFLEPP